MPTTQRRASSTKPDENRLYLDLIKKSLLNLIYGPRGTEPHFNLQHRLSGFDLPKYALTMVGLAALNNIQKCVETILLEKIPGDLIETGVWRGGASIFMRAILKVHGVIDRKVWVADSFQGLPAPDPGYPADQGIKYHEDKRFVIPLDQVKANFAAYELLDEQVQFLPGWFKDTLPKAPVEQLAVLRMDGDLYESTTLELNHLYPRVSPGGFVIVDDYGLEQCRRAVDHYRQAHGITAEMHLIPDGLDARVFWRVPK